CPLCLPPYDTYIVKKSQDAANGLFAARFIYNNVYSSTANNKFHISQHPTTLIGYIKSNIVSGDTALIHIDLFSGNTIVDSASWYETSSRTSYEKLEISVSKNSNSVDSALIRIVGGRKQNTELYVDNLAFIKQN